MRDQNIFDKNFDNDHIDSTVDDLSFIHAKNQYGDAGFQKKRHLSRAQVLAIFILFNLVSCCVLFFILTEGRPLSFVSNVIDNFKNRDKHKLEASLAEDKRQIALAVNYVKDNKAYQCGQIDDRNRKQLTLKFHDLKVAKANSFLQIGDDYFYLSSDKKRLYLCVFPMQMEKKRLAQEAMAKETAKENIPVELPDKAPPKPRYIERDEIYKDKDGVYKNRKKYIPVE